mmetsp:Transcript_20759/g.30117  ORF Transcript_20759/g.30117 Transcript_20759/m.30117 type:complete len:93 (+) Transcript_20759:3-281(+)
MEGTNANRHLFPQPTFSEIQGITIYCRIPRKALSFAYKQIDSIYSNLQATNDNMVPLLHLKMNVKKYKKPWDQYNWFIMKKPYFSCLKECES